MLVRPGADMGSDAPGCIQWELNRRREIPHMVIGETKIGGSWNEYDAEMLTVSFSDWMDMPGFTMEQWLGGRPLVKRLPSVAIATYLKKYVERLRLRKKFHQYFVVNSIKKIGDVWVTSGKRSTDGRSFVIRSKQVVVACGKTSPRKLQVKTNESRHSLRPRHRHRIKPRLRLRLLPRFRFRLRLSSWLRLRLELMKLLEYPFADAPLQNLSKSTD